ncbi:MAG: endo-inulinase [Cyclobacteriaceae bacterium]|nr:MAG: endo-inulinase [Cyclobacteriaceae bacterium]
MNIYRILYGLLTSCLILQSCGPQISDEVSAELSLLPDTISYNFHVKPILSDRCFVCHGPDADNRKAGLRLDADSSAYGKLESGAGYAIVPGRLAKSQLVDRIMAHDPEQMMPPIESNLSLSDQERAVLIKWIEQGAKYESHWAFDTPKKPIVPAGVEGWSINEIDGFIGQKLVQQQIVPAPEAKREQLIRRAYFDITGLPPGIEALNRWMQANDSDFYEKMIDELLDAPAFGERMAAHWLDVARFADSEGYLDDFHHTFWPYRDWVIKAFNQNLPYDKFILWQIGGDQIPDATPEQKLATAFNRNHKQNSEGGIIPEEFRVEYVADRTNTVGAAFLGLTVGCARCHDHKYDPFSQKDYYQLFGFFNSTVERGDGIFSLNAIEDGRMVPGKFSMNAGPVLPLLDDDAKEIRQYLLEKIEDQQQRLSRNAPSNQQGFDQWIKYANQQELSKAIDKATVTHLTFDNMGNGRAHDMAAGAGPATYYGKIEPVDGKFGKAVRSDAYGQLVADGSRSQFERMEPFTISFWLKSPEQFESAHVLYNGNNRIQGYRGWDVVIEDGRLQFRLNHAHPYQSLAISTPELLPTDQWVHFVWTYDGSGDAKGMQVYKDGSLLEMQIDRNYLYRSTKPYLDPEATVYMPYQGLTIGNRHYDQDFTGGVLDEIRILNKQADHLVAGYLYDSNNALSQFKKLVSQQSDQLASFYDLFIDKQLEELRVELRQIQQKEIQLVDTAREIMVMGDYPTQRPTYILNRGVYDARGEQVAPNVPESVFALPQDLPKNRYGLGQWLIHPENPLTSRVAVNQIWYLMFGRGLVETVEDFGSQGALPTHPQLLDWLAVDFQENGWNLKRLIKQMAMSATYRQSSVIRPELQDIDPANYLLARGPRYRRSAEMIRDNILAASGLLETSLGGPSTFPYQPPGLWKEVMTHPFFPEYQEDPKGLYRRSIYTFWKRNMPPPNMLIFDASSRAECQVRRQRSSTPLQALVLLNDPQMIEGCRALAEQALSKSHGEPDQALETVFRILTSRFPTDKEQSIMQSQWEQERQYFLQNPAQGINYLSIGYRPIDQRFAVPDVAATARVVNTILNSTESYYKN